MRESGRSTLLMHRMTGIFAASALRSTKRVCGSGPSEASTRSTTPSTMDRPRSTSPPKSAWPGVSMMLMVTPPGAPAAAAAGPAYRIAVFLARMVMPFSRSRSPESMARSSTCWCSPKAPASQSILSTRVVLPWSTWATMATMRMSPRVCMGMCSSVSGVARDLDHRVRAAGSAHQRDEGVHDGQVRGQPGHGIQLVGGQDPQRVVVLQGLGLPGGDDGQPDGHGVALAQRPRPLQRALDDPAEADLDPELLGDLAVQRLDGVLPRLDLAAGELPAAGELGGLGAPGGEQGGGPVQVVDDGGSDDERARWVGSHDGHTVCPSVALAMWTTAGS